MKLKKYRDRICHNCQTALEKDYNYCPQCGQTNTDNNVSFYILIREFVDTYFSLDSRVAHSTRPFLTQPGKLTNKFQEGKIKHYLHPIRIYFIMSLFYFFTISYLLSKYDMRAIETRQSNISSPTLEEFRTNKRLALISDSTKYELVPDSIKNIYPHILTFEQLFDTLAEGDSAYLKNTKISLKNTRVPFLKEESWVERVHRLARDRRLSNKAFLDSMNFNSFEIEIFNESSEDNHIASQVRKIFENDAGFNEFVLGNLPFMMLFMIPLFAGILKLFYIRTRSLYVQHIVHALHIHSFAYLVYGMGLLILFKILTHQYFPNLDINTYRLFLIIILFVLTSIYAYLSFFKIYKQSWFKTGIKFVFVGVIYIVTLLVFFLLELILSFWYY